MVAVFAASSAFNLSVGFLLTHLFIHKFLILIPHANF